MRNELDQKLCNDYPKLFAQRHLPMTETAMCWGFECGDGWYNILSSLCSNIQSHIDWKNKSPNKVKQVVVTQVKEKFGSLRFYYEGGDDYIRGLVSMAESMSAITCENCGNPGSIRGRGWIYTACDQHTRSYDLEELPENTSESA